MLRVLAVSFMLALTACAITTASQDDGTYFGFSEGKYAKIYFMADESTLNLAFENTGSAPMENLVIVARQITKIGIDETQFSLRVLKPRTAKEISLSLAESGTGEIEVEYYFFPGLMVVGMSPADDPAYSRRLESVSDKVIFKVRR